MKPKRKITKLTLDEVSGVDRPAQVGARVVLIKRADDDRAVIKGLFMDALDEIYESEQPYENTDWSEERRIVESFWPVNRALVKALDATLTFDSLKKKSVIKNIASEFVTKVRTLLDQLSSIVSKREAAMNVDEITKQITESVVSVLGDGEEAQSNAEQIAKALAKPLAEHSTSQAGEVAELRELMKLTAEQREYLDDISKAQDITDEKKVELRKAFLAEGTTSDQRDAVVKAWASSTDVFKSQDGRVFKRSELGASFDPLVEEIKKGEKRDAELRKLQDRDADRQLIEKSRSDLPNLPGDDSTRLALEKTLAGLEEADANKVREMLKAANTSMEGVFKNLGQGGDSSAVDAADKLDEMAKSLIQKNQGMSYHEAYQKVLESDEGDALYNEHRVANPAAPAH